MSDRKRHGIVPAHIVHDELETIRLGHEGKLRPPDVVEAARPKEAILHPLFEWDNSLAAEQYRLHQARNVIRQVEVHYADRTVPKYYNIPEPSKPAESYYQSGEVIIQRPDEFQRALDLLTQKMNSAQRSLADLEYMARHAPEYEEKLRYISVALAAFAAAREAVGRIQ
jgi:hypothetical protein